jgi:hypothetical protein
VIEAASENLIRYLHSLPSSESARRRRRRAGLSTGEDVDYRFDPGSGRKPGRGWIERRPRPNDSRQVMVDIRRKKLEQSFSCLSDGGGIVLISKARNNRLQAGLIEKAALMKVRL